MHQQFCSTWCEIPDYFANVVNVEPARPADSTDLRLHGQDRVKQYTKAAYHITGHDVGITNPDGGQWNFTEESRSAREENIGFPIVQAQPVCHHPGVNLIDTGLELMDGGEGVRNAEGNFQLRVIGIQVEVQVMLDG